MQLPLWYRWRVEAGKQWYRDSRGIRNPHVKLPSGKPATVTGCGTKNIRCAVCGMRYDARKVKFEDVMGHMLSEHRSIAILVYLS